MAATTTVSPPPPIAADAHPLTVREIVNAWWPLAASWLLMGLELPAISAAMARLPDPETSLAAYGGVVFPTALLIESPILLLLAASTALSRDRASYLTGRRVMWTLGLTFTALHGIVAFSPLYDVVARRVLAVPESIVEPARLGLRIMLLWTVSIAFRRFHQGVLIRFGQPRAVSVGTMIRLGSNVAILSIGLVLRRWPGIVVGTTAVVTGVVMEALYTGWRVRPVLRGPLAAAPRVTPPLETAAFMRFYLPLLLTPVFTFALMPLASGAMSRLSRPLDCLATWPALNGFVFALRSSGFAFNEVVVSLRDRIGGAAALRRFAGLLAVATTVPVILLAASPLGDLWFARVSALTPSLAALGAAGLWLALPMPALAALQSLHQGTLVHAHRTRGVTEAVVLCLATAAAVMAAGGFLFRGVPGLWIAMAGLTAGNVAQWAWLASRARGVSER